MNGVGVAVSRDRWDERAATPSEALDSSTFAAYYDAYFPRIYTYVRYRVGTAAKADDLVAEVFEHALTNLHQYKPDVAPPAVWLFAIARNAVNDHLRAEQRHRWVSLEVIREWLSPTPQPEDVVLTRELRRALLVAVSQLSDRERDLVALKFAGHLTNRRIAALTGLTESNVGVILYRALQRLKAELDRSGVAR
jgi:RNA polymerase sigma-70 factor (ECF subfamily)